MVSLGLENKVLNLNIEIKGLPSWANAVLEVSRRMRGLSKRDIIKEALEEFAKAHLKDMPASILKSIEERRRQDAVSAAIGNVKRGDSGGSKATEGTKSTS